MFWCTAYVARRRTLWEQTVRQTFLLPTLHLPIFLTPHFTSLLAVYFILYKLLRPPAPPQKKNVMQYSSSCGPWFAAYWKVRNNHISKIFNPSQFCPKWTYFTKILHQPSIFICFGTSYVCYLLKMTLLMSVPAVYRSAAIHEHCTCRLYQNSDNHWLMCWDTVNG